MRLSGGRRKNQDILKLSKQTPWTYALGNMISVFFQIGRNMIVVIVFLLIINNVIPYNWVMIKSRSCHCDHIPSNLKGNNNLVL